MMDINLKKVDNFSLSQKIDSIYRLIKSYEKYS